MTTQFNDEYCDMLDDLNHALALDPVAIGTLIGTRANCEPTLIDSSLDLGVRVDRNFADQEVHSVSGLALINMVLTSLGYDRIAAVMSVNTDTGEEKLVEFIAVEE